MCEGPLLREKTPAFAPSGGKEHKIPSGFQRRQRMIEVGFLALSFVYGFIYYLNPDVTISPSYCPESDIDECRRPDLVAYKVTSFLSMLIMGCMGVYHWHFSPEVKRRASKDATSEDRLFGYLAASDYQNTVSLCYQVWDIVVSLTIPEHTDPIFLIHHVLASLTAYCSLEYQMVPYYSIFYGGCSEFSSIFLVFLDKDQTFPVTPGGLMDKWSLVCKAMFFLTFTYYRIFGWMYYSFPLWKDCQTVIASGSVEKHRPGMAYFLRLFQFMDFALGALQCYWYYSILQKVAEGFTN